MIPVGAVDQPPGELPPLPTDEPAADDGTAAEAATDGITDAQIRKMMAGFNEQAIFGRAERLQAIADIIGHPVASSKELTKDEASKVIDHLEARPPVEPPLVDESGTLL